MNNLEVTNCDLKLLWDSEAMQSQIVDPQRCQRSSAMQHDTLEFESGIINQHTDPVDGTLAD
jgi:hypothetical protein